MSYFRVVATGAHLSEPFEKVVSTAAEAEAQSGVLRRQAGKHGSVEVWGNDGRKISSDRLRRFAQEEALTVAEPGHQST